MFWNSIYSQTPYASYKHFEKIVSDTCQFSSVTEYYLDKRGRKKISLCKYYENNRLSVFEEYNIKGLWRRSVYQYNSNGSLKQELITFSLTSVTDTVRYFYYDLGEKPKKSIVIQGDIYKPVKEVYFYYATSGDLVKEVVDIGEKPYFTYFHSYSKQCSSTEHKVILENHWTDSADTTEIYIHLDSLKIDVSQFYEQGQLVFSEYLYRKSAKMIDHKLSVKHDHGLFESIFSSFIYDNDVLISRVDKTITSKKVKVVKYIYEYSLH